MKLVSVGAMTVTTVLIVEIATAVMLLMTWILRD